MILAVAVAKQALTGCSRAGLVAFTFDSKPARNT